MTTSSVEMARLDLTGVRSSATRWRLLNGLLQELQHLAQVAAVIDATGSRPGPKMAQAIEFEALCDALHLSFDKETSHLTIELLQAELYHRKRKDKG